ncbi:MAG: trypsin-like peptidase domain-containing protein [Fibrobacteria bacterium]|nr:trypsin-like peptidase domain-containing protein [Fibrobacteria bacterium]
MHINFKQLTIVLLITGVLAAVLYSRYGFSNGIFRSLVAETPVKKVSAMGGAAKNDRKIQKQEMQEDITTSRRNSLVMATEKASPAIVSITVTRARRMRTLNRFMDDPFFDLFLYGGSQPLRESVSSVGSGVLVNSNGYIVTNSHVINAERGETTLEIKVNLGDGRVFNAKVVGMDAQNDIAVIKIKGKNLPVATIQQKEDNLIGEWVMAIGNPFGYLMSDSKATVTVGVISAINRNFSLESGIGYFNMIQTDASINPGNSGGALVNALGEVIGINTFILSGNGAQSGSIGIGFAIPIKKAMMVVKELITYGYIREWTTGIYTDPYYQPYGAVKGIVVSGVQKDSPGYKAGLRKGDVLYAVAGQKADNLYDFLEILRRFQVGETVELKLIRAKKRLKTNMVLEEKPQKR